MPGTALDAAALQFPRDSDTSGTPSWPTVMGATQYQIREIADPSDLFTIAHSTDTYTVPDLTCGTTYTVKIQSHGLRDQI